MGIQFTALAAGDDWRPIYVEGFDQRDEDHPRGFFGIYGWNIGNAVAMFGLLGIEGDPDYGSITIADARRAVMRATALFERKAPQHTRPSETRYGAPREAVDGSIELRPIRVVSGGLTVEQMRDKLTTFGQYVEAAAQAGAARIQWS
jgi:hypothetical protein